MNGFDIPPVTQAEIDQWWHAKRAMDHWKSLEALLRRRICAFYFPDPKEGVNNLQPESLNGFVMKMTHPVTRKVDKEALAALTARPDANTPSRFEQANIDVNRVIRWTPELNVGEYRKLTAEEIKLIDQALIISEDGMPALEIKAPTKKVK
jgi:hypothetical protein